MLLGQAGCAASAPLCLVTSFAVAIIPIIAKHQMTPSSVLSLVFSVSPHFRGDVIQSMALNLICMLMTPRYFPHLRPPLWTYIQLPT